MYSLKLVRRSQAPKNVKNHKQKSASQSFNFYRDQIRSNTDSFRSIRDKQKNTSSKRETNREKTKQKTLAHVLSDQTDDQKISLKGISDPVINDTCHSPNPNIKPITGQKLVISG